MSYELVLARAKALSDHHDHVQEIEPAILEAIKSTPEDSCVIEIGNLQGGSAILLMYHSKGRKFITVDANDWMPPAVPEWAAILGIHLFRFVMLEQTFVRNHLPENVGFIYFDSTHEQKEVEEDVRISIPKLAKRAIVAIDDVQDWPTLPEFEGLERVNFPYEHYGRLGVHGEHIIFFRKL